MAHLPFFQYPFPTEKKDGAPLPFTLMYLQNQHVFLCSMLFSKFFMYLVPVCRAQERVLIFNGCGPMYGFLLQEEKEKICY